MKLQNTNINAPGGFHKGHTCVEKLPKMWGRGIYSFAGTILVVCLAFSPSPTLAFFLTSSSILGSVT